MSDLIRARQEKLDQQPIPKPLDPKKLREIDRKAKILSVANQLRKEYVDLKFAHLENKIYRCVKRTREFRAEYDGLVSAIVADLEEEVFQLSDKQCRLLEHEYCNIVFGCIPKWHDQVSKATRAIWTLRSEFCEMALVSSQRSTLALAALLEHEYLKPRRTARARIDGLLRPGEIMLRQYDRLQMKFNAVAEGMRNIRFLCQGLIMLDTAGDDYFTRFFEHTRNFEIEFNSAAHQYRYEWRLRKNAENPLSAVDKGWNDGIFSGISHPSSAFSSPASYIWAIMSPEKRLALATLRNRQLSAMYRRLRQTYFETWKGPTPPWSPTLHRDWRQLDVMAPFTLQAFHVNEMRRDVWVLLLTLKGHAGPMWQNVDPDTLKNISEKLAHFSDRYTAMYKEFRSELSSYRYINWVKLDVQEKQHRLGILNDSLAKELYRVPRPLSSDPKRFRDWALKICTSANRAGTQAKVWSLLMQPDGKETYISLTKRFYNERLGSSRVLDLGSTESLQQKAKLTELPSSSRRNNTGKNKGISRTEKPRTVKRSSTTSTTGKVVVPSKEVSQSAKESAESASGPHEVKTKSHKRSTAHAVKSSKRLDEKSPRQTMSSRSSQGSSTSSYVKMEQKEILRTLWKPKMAANSPNPSTKPGGRAYSTQVKVSGDELQGNDHTPAEPSTEFIAPLAVEKQEKRSISSEDASYLEVRSLSEEVIAPLFWSHSTQRAPDGQKLIVHYCRTLESTEAVVQKFLHSKVIGFDMEWKAQALSTDSIQNNLSLIQIANEERIALFQIALFKPARTAQDFVAPSLRRLLESPDITKVGVSIKADCTRLRKYLGIEACSIFELSHLYKLVKYGQTEPKLVNKRPVNLSEQIEEHFGLPLEKSEDVRCSDWTRALNYRQVQYAATDPYAGLCLFNIMEQKRQAMDPMPPRPAHAELNLPIICPGGKTPIPEDKGPATPDPVEDEIASQS
ncbi:hypothetical protein N7462_006231 [Penicillium macrosclerotiorum]|uniref:uncharacterized protein n=1 Tax=Penicillium macrosclerotiorum TaxID=303699 RepID=UPI002548986A|nr:uncharacterized protein N7462_006231 [Penicillium macrosclerotiorum]KAJ5683066.1 hypothetical protein N7462_006231 [Penicillium macrosclerotiorum]